MNHKGSNSNFFNVDLVFFYSEPLVDLVFD